MLSENIKSVRKAKGLSQEELALKINVVRQTVSKWEQGLSVPDADLLIALSEALETPVSVLLGETVTAPETDEVKALAEKLSVINLQFARQKEGRRKALHVAFLSLCFLVILIYVVLFVAQSPYLHWDYSDPETAVFGAAFHVFEYLFVRAAPMVLVLSGIGAFRTRKPPKTEA